ncbi:MAG: hypothetical protein ABIR88_09645 [Nitrospiria bacterium]
MRRRAVVVGLLLCILAGCGHWLRVGGPYTSTADGISLEFPDGWMRSNTEKDVVLITRDGVLLQYMMVQTFHVNDALRFTKKKFRRDMLPQEVAEVILDNKASNPSTLTFKVEENVPAKVGGRPGFRVSYTFKNKDGLRLKGLYYGTLVDDRFYGISYTAAARHYFDLDRKTFENVFRTFRIDQAS